MPGGNVCPVRLVHRIGLTALRNAHALRHEHERSDRRIQHEHVDAPPRRQDEHRGRAVEDVSGRDLARTALAQRLDRAGNRRVILEDGKNGAHADAHVQIRGAIERIEDDTVFTAVDAALENASARRLPRRRRPRRSAGCRGRSSGCDWRSHPASAGLRRGRWPSRYSPSTSSMRARRTLAAIALPASDIADKIQLKSPVAPG